jgi:hypothetical protein
VPDRGRRSVGPALAALAILLGVWAQPVAAEAFRLLRIDGAHVKWGRPALGSGAAVTYGFAAGNAAFPDAINCRELGPMAALSPAWRYDHARLAQVAAAAFAMWAGEADLEFRPAGPGEPPDILIGTQSRPRGIAFANVWHGTPDQGVAPLTRATICFNPTIVWTTEEGADNGALDLGTVLAHEIGHAIGLDHPGATGALMAYSNQGDIDALMAGDIAGARAIYGPRSPD